MVSLIDLLAHSSHTDSVLVSILGQLSANTAIYVPVSGFLLNANITLNAAITTAAMVIPNKSCSEGEPKYEADVD